MPIASVPLVTGVEPADGFQRWLLERIEGQPSAGRRQSTVMRHRLEYASCPRALIAIVRVTPARGARGRHRARARVLHVRRRAPPHRAAQPGDGLSVAARGASGARSPARPSRISAACCSSCCSSRRCRREQMLARVEFDGEERSRLRLRAGQGRAVHHRALRLLGAAGDGARGAGRAGQHPGARARQPASPPAARRHPPAHRQHGCLPARARSAG